MPYSISSSQAHYPSVSADGGHITPRGRWLILVLLFAALLTACGTPKRVEPGQYRVASGDTLSSIARKHGQSVSSLMRLNNITNPNLIQAGQILRVQSSGTSAASTDSSIPATSIPPPRQQAAPKGPAPPRSIALTWPAEGTVNRSMPKPSPYGIFIVNDAGTPVKAVANGTVIYAGNGLRGYGNLSIIRHASGFLSVYAHNRTLMVREGQTVKQGQKIAEMGNTESNSVALYFELRYNGKATDATRFLPKR